MLQVVFSNRFEALLEGVVDALAQSPASPFEAQHVIVPSMAVRRRIELAVADRLGICANVEFSFLGQWLWRQISRLVPVADVSPFAPAVLAWRVHEVLGDRAFVDQHARLRRYLGGADPLMRYELALRIAALFDQYITYRPDWLAQWIEGRAAPELAHAGAQMREDERWQAALWRHIAAGIGTGRQHPASAFFDAIASAGSDALRAAGIPGSAHVFCLPSVPPLYLDMLRQLGRFVDLRLAVLNPCREYWFDIVDRRRLSYLAAQGTLDYQEVGNPLLASWGRQRKAQLSLLFADNGDARVDEECFAPAGGRSTLARVQDAILDLRDLPPGSLADVAPDDRSIEVHVCHSFTRELEALHDYLLGLFAGRSPPRPSDILVVTPALDDAAPLIDAVFGTASGNRCIPYVVTGRGRSAVNPAARALLDLLAVATSRFPATAVMEVLQQPIVARRFGVAEGELARIRDWIRGSGIRWGSDAAHRAQCQVPPLARYTFEDGLQRLYLGYALPSPTGAGAASADATGSAANAASNAALAPFGDRLPAGHAEGTDALALGRFWAFMQALERLRRDVVRPKPPAGWMASLLEALDTFLDPARDQIEDLREVQAIIGELHADMAAGGADAPIPLEVVSAALEAALDDPARGGVPTGAVTFSAMSSLRDLPYRVICVIGLCDGAWPRAARPGELDLMAAFPRAGDRQRGDDDRNVFLDLLLAARERLYLSYVGRSVRDNTPLPPSVLVAELLDCIVPAIAGAGADAKTLEAARERLVVEHPLQPFSVECFTSADVRKRSFNAEYCEALREPVAATHGATLTSTRASMLREAPPASPVHSTPADMLGDEPVDEDEADERLAPFFTVPLALDGDEWRNVTLAQLARFFSNPCAYLLRNRLGIRLDETEEELCDDEPFVAGWADRKALVRRLLPAYLRGTHPDDILALARAGTEYPPGRLGARLLERELAHLEAFTRELAPALEAPCLAPVDGTVRVAVDGEAWLVTAAFGDLRASGLVRHRYDDARPGDYVRGWLEHLFVNLLDPSGATPSTTWHSRDGRYVLPPIPRADAESHLQALLQLYARGLTRPLHFFPRSAWEYARNEDDLRKAARTWQGSPFARGEKDDRAYRLALRGVVDPLDAEFEESATAVFAPLLGVIRDPRLGKK